MPTETPHFAEGEYIIVWDEEGRPHIDIFVRYDNSTSYPFVCRLKSWKHAVKWHGENINTLC